VDHFMGTAHSRWMIAPGPWMPFGMVKLSPENQDAHWIAGYDFPLEHINGFSHIHEWTMAGLLMMPANGPLKTTPGTEQNPTGGYSSRFDKSTEKASTGYYSVFLKDSGIRAELTATTRAGLQRYTFPKSEQSRVMIDLLFPAEYRFSVEDALIRRVNDTTLEGYSVQKSPNVWYPGDEQLYTVNFVLEFSKPFTSLGGWLGTNVLQNANEIKGKGDIGGFVTFSTMEGEGIMVRSGISLVSIANARLNLEQELSKPFGWNFDSVVKNQRKAWNEILGRVEIETDDYREKVRFYSNLYRSYCSRNIWSDVNGQWRDPDETIRTLPDPKSPVLGCDAFWNTFWNLNQVWVLLTPQIARQWVNSQLALYDAGGWLSKGPAGMEYISVMVAEHEIPLIVAAYQAGIRGFDISKAYEACRKMQTTLPQKLPGGSYVGNENLEPYLRLGYIPHSDRSNRPHSQEKWLVSNTLEYSYDDWTLAQLAKELGKEADAQLFSKRAENWRNIFDEKSGFMRPKREDGTWLEPFDPYHTPGFTEGNAWQYTWFVPQNIPGLIAAMGKERFVSRLNEAMERSSITRFNATGERYELFPVNHGNQPSMQVGWLFNYADAPWLTQKWIREILDRYYGHGPQDAYLGDEDQGQMSAWFVMAAMGLFQTDGGCRTEPIFELGTPLYRKITLHLDNHIYPGKTFTIEARTASRSNKYIQSAKLNGQTLNKWWISQRTLVRGGTLTLELGPTPNQNWARGCTP
jgi:predicted alpha-1,2-mannosidase